MVASIIGGSDNVYKINWGSACCEQGALEPPFIRYTDDNPVYECNTYTDECRIQLHPDREVSIFGTGGVVGVAYTICNVDGSNCGFKTSLSWGLTKGADDVQTVTIPYGKEIRFSTNSLKKSWKYIKYEATYKPFFVKGMENGKVFISQSCYLNTELQGKTLTDGVNRLEPSPSSPNHCQSYLLDYNLVTTKIYRHNAQDVICQARNIYKIDTENFKDGGSIRVQGDRITDVECCPHEANCDEDFKFVDNRIRDCTRTAECIGGGDPFAVTGTSYSFFTCVNEKCELKNPISVECTNNAVCNQKYNENMICENWQCKKPKPIEKCGDGFCDDLAGETPTSCPEDCNPVEEKPYSWTFLLIFVVIFVLLWYNRAKITSLVKRWIKI